MPRPPTGILGCIRKNLSQLGEGSGPSPILSTGETHLSAVSSSGLPVQERQGHTGGICYAPVKGHNEDNRIGASVMRKKAERAGTDHPGEEEAPGGSHQCV